NFFQKIDYIRKARIGVMFGSHHDVFVTKEMTEAEIIRIETEPDLFLALQQGKCDVIFADFTNFLVAQSQYPEMVEVPSDFPADFYGVGFHKENRDLQAKFNAFLKEIRESGLYQEIYDRWIFHGTESEMPAIEIPTNGDPLCVAVPGSLYPFSFMKNQDLVGFDIELMLRFAQKMQRPVDFQMIGFGSLIASLQSGKSDIISAAMCITEERQKMVLFSDPYFETRIVVATIPQGASRAVDERSFWQSLKDSFTSNLLVEKRYLLILEGLQTTVVISIFSILLGTLLGALVCFMRMHKSLWCRIVASSYISLMRGMPVLVLLMLMFYVFLAELPVDGVQVAIITFALNFSAYVSEMFRTAIEGVDRGQTEAGIALGFTPSQTFYHIVMPQAIKNVMPVYKGETISLIKMTSIVGYIAVEDLTKMSDIIRSRTFDAFFPLIMVAILYFILAWIFGKALDMLNPKHQPES
ncbi:MAG: ABC transporter substrate-binding protein/permease, partial [Parabacteroides sp.]|nr:ABC transporter substrate-binding protein/permease [Parabacteroides sp.]